jgi:predicted transcriptional regulator
MHDALISIRPTYVEKLLSGEKAVEMRNRPVNLSPGTRLWIYSTLPKGCVQAVAHVHRVEVGAPVVIWKQYSALLGVSKKGYHRYVNGSTEVSAIVVKRIWKLPFDLSLNFLRSKIPGFHPPQFLKYMNESDPLLCAIIDFLFENSGIDYCDEIGLRSLFSRGI